MMNKAIALYRKTLIPMQIGIVAVCAVAAFRRLPLLGVLVIFLVMEFGAFLGALWGARLQRRVEQARERNSGMLDGRALR
jgi:hypothetical protein